MVVKEWCGGKRNAASGEGEYRLFGRADRAAHVRSISARIM